MTIQFGSVSRGALPLLAGLLIACGGAPEPFFEIGSMREVLALGQHESRATLAELLEQDHLYAVGALAGLEGEITILDSQAFVTSPGPDGKLRRIDPAGASVTMLVGQPVADWTSTSAAELVLAERFDAFVADTASENGVDLATPFAFVVEGEFVEVRLHVLHGACPVHARRNGIELAADERPFEWEVAKVRGTLVGVYAENAVGKITHPATSVHAHLIFDDPDTGQRVTGHLERVGMRAGSVLKVPR